MDGGQSEKHDKHGQMGRMVKISRKYTVVNEGSKSNMVKWERGFESQDRIVVNLGNVRNMILEYQENILRSTWETKATWSNRKESLKVKIELWPIWET